MLIVGLIGCVAVMAAFVVMGLAADATATQRTIAAAGVLLFAIAAARGFLAYFRAGSKVQVEKPLAAGPSRRRWEALRVAHGLFLVLVVFPISGLGVVIFLYICAAAAGRPDLFYQHGRAVAYIATVIAAVICLVGPLALFLQRRELTRRSRDNADATPPTVGPGCRRASDCKEINIHDRGSSDDRQTDG